MSALSDLYRSAVLEHNRNPRNFGELERFTHQGRGLNALCGDDIRIYLSVSEAGVVEDVKFSGQASAITLASASMMTETITNQSLERVWQIFELLIALLDGKDLTEDEQAVLGELCALEGVLNYPSRVASAKLPWEALIEALDLPQ